MFIRLGLLFLLLPLTVLAVNPACPNFTPSPTQSPVTIYSYTYGKNSPEESCTQFYINLASAWVYHHYVEDTSTAVNYRRFYCYGSYGVGSTNINTHGAIWRTQSTGCPTGYTLSGSICNLTAPDSVPCPANNCPLAGIVPGGMADSELTDSEMSGHHCRDGCSYHVRQTEVTTGYTDESGVTKWFVRPESDGYPCATGAASTPVSVNSDGSSTNGPTTVKPDPTKPGCGFLNGQPFCAKDIPSGKCILVPPSGYVCAGTGNTSPKPHTVDPTNPPSNPLPIQVPIGNGPDALPGPDPDGNGRGNGEVGNFPKPPGGSDINGDPTDLPLDGATEHDQHEQTGLLKDIKGLLTNSGPAPNSFVWGTMQKKEAYQLSAADWVQINTLKQSITTKISTIKSEFSVMTQFNYNGSAGSMVCPANSYFSFMGSNISLCTPQILEYTSYLSNIILFAAFIFSLYIVFL